jgi:hypothetical protein
VIDNQPTNDQLEKTMSVFVLKPGVRDLIDGWHRAKEVEKTWQEYRLKCEEAILAQYPDELAELKGQLKQGTSLSQTVKLGDLKVSVGRTLKISQAEAAIFCMNHPELVNVLLKYEYKPANSAALLGAMHHDGKLGEEVNALIESLNDSKPSFSKA